MNQRVVLVLAVAVLGISSSAVLVRLMEAGPAAITFWRCLVATAVLAPTLRGLPRLALRDRLLIGVSGLFLGLHFTTWFASLEHTTVLRSTVLVAMVPGWTGLLEWIVLKRRPALGFWLGLALALAGIGMFATREGEGSLYGDGLAFLAALFWAVYLLVGRDVRQRIAIFPYMALVSLVAAVTVLPYAFVSATPLTGFGASTWALFVAAAVGPQLMGHQGLGYAVKYVDASTVATVMLLEPVGASVLALLILGEWPPVAAIFGAVLVLLGVGVALNAQRQVRLASEG